jgi:hypothetical protein
MIDLPPESIILTRYLEPAEHRRLLLRHRRSEVVQLHRGAYVESAWWATLGVDAQHRARAVAVAAHFGDDLVFSHLTAAAAWRLPRMGSWPSIPHVAGPLGGADRNASFVRHGLGIPAQTATIDGLLVTSLCATVVDVASTVGFAQAVTVADAALRRSEHPLDGVPRTALNREQLLTELGRVGANHGAAKARRAIEFADGRADRPGESMSRVSMQLARVSAPQLQTSLIGASGKSYVVDFWWEEFNVIGEFDGKNKYTDPEYMNGRTPQRVLYDEKVREDDLRAASHGFTRWPWAVAISPTLLRAHLARAGIR